MLTVCGEQMLSQRMAIFLECLESNNCMVHTVSHDSKARGKHLLLGNLLRMHTAASVDTLQQNTYTISNSKKCI